MNITPLEGSEDITFGKIIKRTASLPAKALPPKKKKKTVKAVPEFEPLPQCDGTLTVAALNFYRAICSNNDFEKILKYYD